jgi:3D (Asp-Asp-Asp) domain-containing protein
MSMMTGIRKGLMVPVVWAVLACGSDGGGLDADQDTDAADTASDEGIEPDPALEPDLPGDVEEDVEEEEGEQDPGTLVGDCRVTFYWVAYEGDFTCAEPDTDLATCDGEVIARVCLDFAEAARLEGTARLEDGRMINVGGCSCSGGFSCFVVLDQDLYPWGMGNRSNALVPFYSVATDVDVIPSGTVLYSPEIDGIELPEDAGGGIHDGCLRADDVGGGISGMHIDFFAALREWYQEIDPQVPETVTLYRDPPRCLPGP